MESFVLCYKYLQMILNSSPPKKKREKKKREREKGFIFQFQEEWIMVSFGRQRGMNGLSAFGENCNLFSPKPKSYLSEGKLAAS